MVEGDSYQQIASKRYTTLGTTKTHAGSILCKLGVKTREEASVMARALGLVPLDKSDTE
jgi:DNA-binding NarL/FixJ family response regulator